MLGLAIELRTDCRRCGQPVMVNAFSERIVCRACNSPTSIDEDDWQSILEDAFGDFMNLEVDEGQPTTIMTDRNWELIYGRQLPRCGACKTTFPDQALELAERGWAICVACGKRFSIRLAPPLIARFGAVALVNEDPAQIAGTQSGDAADVPRAANPVVFSCPRCAGALSVDGSNRLVRCQYCTSDVYLPDDLWQRLHPVATVSRWYAWFREDSAEERMRTGFLWREIHHAVMGPDHQLYCIGTDMTSDTRFVWSMGLDTTIRWMRDLRSLEPRFDYDAKLTVDAQNRVYVWRRQNSKAVVVSAIDGSTIGNLGTSERDETNVHVFDLNHGNQLHVDIDGTLLALIHRRLLRYAPDGSALATWPPRPGMFGPKPEKLRPLYDDGSVVLVDDPSMEQVADQPLGLRTDALLCVGRDGRLFAHHQSVVACFDRTGKVAYRARLPASAYAVGTDGYGQLYAVVGRTDQKILLRIAPDGTRIDTLAMHRSAGGVLGHEDALVVSPDGMCYLLGYGNSVRVIAPDGRLVHQNDGSRKRERVDDGHDDES
jgi:DNA-directed RNA polymerase subunit RPC12/RpoP